MRNISATAKALTRATLAGTAVALTLTLGTVAAQAQTAVTFNPGSFAPGASSFTADVLNLKDFSRVDLGNSSGGTTSFTENGFLQVNNISLNGETSNPAGNRSAYSMYFQYTGTGTQNSANFTSDSQGVFNSLSYTLYGVSGASSFSVAGGTPSVTNAPGATPVTLATGSLISGKTSFTADPTGAAANISATYVEQLANFILSPANSTLRLFGAFNNNEQIVTVLNQGRSFTINGGGGDVSFTATPTPVPEPASMMIFGTALAGLGAITRRRRKTA